MHGNVWEWCDDAVVDSKGDSARANRGGSWSTPLSNCRVAYRNISAPAFKNDSIGLRVGRVRAPVSPTVYLDELTEQSYVGFGTLGNPRVAADIRQQIDKDFGSVTATRGLVLHPVENPSPPPQLAAILKYNLAGKYASLEMTALCRAQRANPLLIELLGDGKTLTPSEDLTKHQPSGLPISADVRGVRELTILVTAKTSKDFGHVLLIDPRLRAATQAAAWQLLFNGKDLTGLKQTGTGSAEVVVDGQPYLRLQDKSNLRTPRFGDYHLRLEFRPERGTSITVVADNNARLVVSSFKDGVSQAALIGNEMTYESATLESGRFIGSGQTIDSQQRPFPDPLGRLTFKNATPNLNTPWQRLEIIRLGDSCAVLLNGQLAAAATNIRITRDGEPPKSPGQTEIGLTAYGGPASYRNIEIREITSLPPEVSP